MDNDKYLQTLKEGIFKRKPKTNEPKIQLPAKAIFSEKVKNMTVNVLPPDLRKIALTWPAIIKTKIGYTSEDTNRGKSWTAKQINDLNKEDMLESLEYIQDGAYDWGGNARIKMANFNIEFVNEKLLFCFLITNRHSKYGWCYSPVDKNVYYFFGHDEADGFGESETKTKKIPYKKWIQLWIKISTLKPLMSKPDVYGEPDIDMRDCLTKQGTINKLCKPYNYQPQAYKYCINMTKRLPKPFQTFFTRIENNGGVLPVHLKEDDRKFRIERDDIIEISPLNDCAESYKNQKELQIMKKGFYAFGSCNDYILFISLKTPHAIFLLDKRNNFTQWFDSANQFLATLTLISPMMKDLANMINK